jgi:hypothetical protein
MTTFLVNSQYSTDNFPCQEFFAPPENIPKNPGEKTSGKRKQLSGVLQRAVFMENS